MLNPNETGIQEADINLSASGDNTLIAALANAPIKIYQIFIVANAAVNITFKDGAATNFNAFAIPLTAQGSSLTRDYTSIPHWVTTAGNAFIVNLSGAVQITGRVYFTKDIY